MTSRGQRGRKVSTALSVLGVFLVTVWAIMQDTAQYEGVVLLAGVAGTAVFLTALTAPLGPRRHHTMATGLLLIGTAVVVAASAGPSGHRTATLIFSGAVLFWRLRWVTDPLSNSAEVRYAPELTAGAQFGCSAWLSEPRGCLMARSRSAELSPAAVQPRSPRAHSRQSSSRRWQCSP